MSEVNIMALIKTSSEHEDDRHLQDVFKTSSSRQMFAGLFPFFALGFISNISDANFMPANSVRMQENTDQNNSEYGQFLRS